MILLSALLACVLYDNRAFASDFDAFQQARDAYEVADYALAGRLFESLVGGDTPALNNPTLILESLKYLAVSHLFLGNQAEAKASFRRLLAREPTYSLDPMEFPEEVQRVFKQVLEAVAQRQAAERNQVELEAQQKRNEEEVHADQQRAQREALLRLATTDRVEIRRSRLPTLVPFGIGQFQNGDDTLGALLAISEGALVAASAITYALHRDLDGQLPTPAERSEAIYRGRALRYSNQISMAVLAVVAVAGIVEAQLSYRPTEVHKRRRALPAELVAEPEATIHMGAAGLHGTF